MAVTRVVPVRSSPFSDLESLVNTFQAGPEHVLKPKPPIGGSSRTNSLLHQSNAALLETLAWRTLPLQVT